MISGSLYASLAGFLGAAASLSAKLSLGADYVIEMCETGLREWTDFHDSPAVCEWVHYPLRLLCVGLLFMCNVIMWTFFSKALQKCSSSATATVTTTASNFIFSGIFGKLIFAETHAALWWAGICLTLSGLLLLHGTTHPTLSQEEHKKNN
ncbi:unnamed protein product [Menidia menidia]|uniref:(Atlantic silverside) hypothetical protein n=1 Tax=Menidia menidia TaxID=238744 RepID=A0A8S4BSX7_9TELE|nr:unnamed protein product [Menidia menidia]